MTGEREREAIVAWLRALGERNLRFSKGGNRRDDVATRMVSGAYLSAAKMIERGDHLKGTTDAD